MNRKAEISENVHWILNISLVAITIFLINISLNTTAGSYTETQGMEYDLLNERIIDSLSYVDPLTLNMQKGIIDLANFNENTLNRTLKKTARNFGVKVTLEYEGQTEQIYFSKQDYEDFRIFKNVRLKKPVKIINGDKVFDGMIEVEQAVQTRGLVQVEEDEK